ncbi:hypothetical protein [Mesoplasma melaleucae]|uniref:Uncharacterized protein n=1 Tax=Mesoplasma melaleucae TaxID=81459 RepID=A0A2K8NWG1_9MOLU|nr:hypothetical protein [Mesoplasma melaleucae]ATZ18159.1 hypothetical protein EMELA_v1c06520 [Mesoplasma melaleucae]
MINLSLLIEVDLDHKEIRNVFAMNPKNISDTIKLLNDKKKLQMSQEIKMITKQLTDPLKVTTTRVKNVKPKENRINWKAEYFKLKAEFDEFKEFAINVINELRAENAVLKAEIAVLKAEIAVLKAEIVELKEQVKYYQDKYELVTNK